MNYYKLTEEVFDYEMLFPEEYKAIRNLVLYDKKVKRTINKEYPENTIFNILKTVQYNNELINVENGIITNTTFSQLAQKRFFLFKKMSQVTHGHSSRFGKESTFKMIDTITKYITELNEDMEYCL